MNRPSNHRKLMQLIKDNLKEGQEPGYRLENRSPLANGDQNRPAFLIYDVIDAWWGVSAEQIKRDLLNVTATDIDVFINSPGGDVFEASAIHSAFVAHPANIHVHIEGHAASAATRVATAGDTIEIAESGFYMIHYAWTLGFGNANELRATADMLDKVDQTIVDDYINKTGVEESQIRDWMEKETWFTAAEAVEHGFVDSIIQRQGQTENSLTNKARNWNLSVYENAPEKKPVEDLFQNRERFARFANMLSDIG